MTGILSAVGYGLVPLILAAWVITLALDYFVAVGGKE